MKFLAYFSILALPLLLVCAGDDSVDPPKDLVIETTYMPDECTIKPELYDRIGVHYVRDIYSMHSNLL